MDRNAAVAGTFYPGSAKTLRRTLARMTECDKPPEPCQGLVCPHAGYIYSGRTAGLTFARAEIPETVILLGPNHRGFGARAAVYPQGHWSFPTGSLAINGELAADLVDRSGVLAPDETAHSHEHSLEVQLPIIHHLAPDTRIVPIALGRLAADECRDIAQALDQAAAAAGRRVLIAASTDFTHGHTESEAHRLDHRALDPILSYEPERFLELVRREGLTVCGPQGVTAMMLACRGLGARRASLVKYTTSAEASGDTSYVVGYAGVLIQ